MRYLILNRSGELSLFRLALYEVMKEKGTRLIFGYGFLESSKITDDFIKQMKAGFAHLAEPEIILIGNNENDYSKYMQAIKKIKSHFPRGDLRLLIKQKNKYGNRQYHKKLALKITDNHTVLALLGSSNISSATLDDKPYNQEVDILLWNSFLIDSAREIQLLSAVNKQGYMNRFQQLRNAEEFLRTSNVKVDLCLEFEVDDILKEVNNYQKHGFDVRYISEFSNDFLSNSQLKSLISEHQTDMQTIKECLMYVYRYTLRHLYNQNNIKYLDIYI